MADVKVGRKALKVNWMTVYYPADITVVGCLKDMSIICVNPVCGECELVKEGEAERA
jgi:hypothetical protein